MITSININELKKIQEKINIIDLRSEEKYNNKHIPNAINIPSNKLLLSPEKYLKKDTRYYLYCQKGMNSYSVCKILSKQGYKVTNIIGGYESWIMNSY